jgi:hypothetical protein
MAESTPADELRAAAAKLRKRGSEATPGPWERPLNTRYKHVVMAPKPDDEQGQYLDGRPERVGVVQLNIWSDGTFMRERGGRDLEWIALVHPGIAEPLANWLDHCVKDLSDSPAIGGGRFVMCDEPTSVSYALKVARVINKAGGDG